MSAHEPTPLRNLVGRAKAMGLGELARRANLIAERHTVCASIDDIALPSREWMCSCGRKLPCPDAEIIHGRVK